MTHRLLLTLLFFASACTVAEEPTRVISVTGSGVATAEPDRAMVQMSIVARSKSLDEAQSAAGKVTAAVLALTDKLDIERNKVDTTSATVRPDYRWNRESEEQELRGYIAERQMNVRVDDLNQLGKLIEGAVSAGVNQVSPPQLDSSRRKEANREALAAAAKDARANAEVLAKTLEVSLGNAISINAGGAMPPTPRPMMRMAADAMESGPAATYNAGDLSFSASVSVVFELTD